MANKNPIPPKLARRFLQWFLKDHLTEEVEGDLEEQFMATAQQSSLIRARTNYWYEVFRYLRPFAMKGLNNLNLFSPAIFRHNMLLAYRNFRRYKSTFLINLTGLSTGLACALLIYLWVNDELSVDKFHEKDERLYQVMERWESRDGIAVDAGSSALTIRTLVEEMPEVEYGVAVAPPEWRGFDGFVLTVNEHDIRARGQYAGKDYFNIFSYKLLQGDADQVLSDKNSIAVSRELAENLFHTSDDVVGKTVEFQHQRELKITGVFENIPSTSSVKFDFVLPFEAYLDIAPWYLNWGNTGPHSYVILREGTNISLFNHKIRDLIAKKTNGDFTSRKLFLTPYSDRYLYGNYENGVQSGGRIEYIKLFSIIAVFILVIACINFMNLSTAEATVRLKEVGVKKALGALRRSVAAQYFSESMLMTLLSFLMAILLVALILPKFNIITGKQLVLNFDVRLLASMAGIALVTGLVAGSYPALYLSGFNPVTVLKGKVKASAGGQWIRKGLVAFQFTLTIILMVSVIVVYRQIDFVRSKNLGYNKDNVIYFDVEGHVKENPETFLSELKSIPGIQNAAGTTHNMIGHNWSFTPQWEGKDPDDLTQFQVMAVNYDFLETMGLQMAEGRFFSREYANDSSRIIFNQAAINHMGYDQPIGRKAAGGAEIIGVVRNFHFKSFHEPIEPMCFFLNRKSFAPPSLIMVRIEAGREAETLKRLNEFYADYNPGFPLDYTFLDEDYQAQYVAEQRVSTLSRYFAGLAIVISCLGLFGLAAFTVQRRFKEIGIRKVLGSSDLGIMQLLSGEFTRIVLVAIALALPASYILTRQWLNEFVYRIDLEWWFFAVSGFMGLAIAWITVGLHTFKASRINPVECLKDE